MRVRVRVRVWVRVRVSHVTKGVGDQWARARLKQRPHHRRVPRVPAHDQRRLSFAVRRLEPRAAPQQQAHDLEPAERARPVQRRAYGRTRREQRGDRGLLLVDDGAYEG